MTSPTLHRPHIDYFVKDGHTLGYIYKAQPNVFNVLAGSVLKGGYDPLCGFVHIFGPDRDNGLRPATLEDFETFRVSPKGHIVP